MLYTILYLQVFLTQSSFSQSLYLPNSTCTGAWIPVIVIIPIPRGEADKKFSYLHSQLYNFPRSSPVLPLVCHFLKFGLREMFGAQRLQKKWIEQWFSKWITATRILGKNGNFWMFLITSHCELLNQNLGFKTCSRWFWSTANFESTRQEPQG
jgi:hypothetical protein